jgi:hypothetical protein
MTMSHTNRNRFAPIEVAGVVLDAGTGKPLSRFHVFTRKGEEEAFTNEGGLFRFTSYQNLPLVVTIHQPGGTEKEVHIATTPVRLRVLFP